jgi:transcriptional antiterminator RfaH
MTDDFQWYCLHTRPKNEGTTSQLLRAEIDVEVFCPLIRFERARREGKAWVTEAMFPGYVFARFSFDSQHRKIQSTRGVIKIVRFGEHVAVVPEDVIATLREAISDEQTIILEAGIRTGDEVNLVEGPFRGLRAVVTRILPAQERVAVLLELLGAEREIELSLHAILPDTPHPLVRPETT